MSSSVETAGAAGIGARPAERPLPVVPLPQAPAAALLWSRGLTVASILVTLFTLDVITVLFSDYWLFESLGLTDVFWTNFRMGAELYVAAFVAFAAAIAAPAFLHDVGPRCPPFRRPDCVSRRVGRGLPRGHELLGVSAGRKGIHVRRDRPGLRAGHRLLRLRPPQHLDRVAVSHVGGLRVSGGLGGLRQRVPRAPERDDPVGRPEGASRGQRDPDGARRLGPSRAPGRRRSLADPLRPPAQEQFRRLHDQARRPVPRRGRLLLEPDLHHRHHIRRPRLHAGDRVLAEAAARPDAGPAAASASSSPARSRSRSSSPTSRSRASS